MQVGLIGLGPMGRNLALNLRDADHAAVVWDPWPQAASWQADGITAADDLSGLVAGLQPPRLVLLMVKAGEPVEALTARLAPLLSPGDVVMDGGNSHYRDSEDLGARLGVDGIGYLGIGISGGAEGARHGPAMMAGGDETSWTVAEPLLASIAARSDGEPCLAWFGTGGAGHFVKMVHNGIEYAAMEAIAEACDLLAAGGESHAAIAGLVDKWSGGELAGYLMDITAEIYARLDEESGGPLIDIVSDRAGQKGTGNWCCEAGLDFAVPLPSIAQAVAMRQLSVSQTLRQSCEARASKPAKPLDPADVEAALGASIIVALAQGFDLLGTAAAAKGWPATPAAAARVWRNGSILRMALLQEATKLPAGTPFLSVASVHKRLEGWLPGWRRAAAWGLENGLAIPVTAAGLAYWNAINSARLPTALVQAQRDRFGDHGFERTDRPGIHHGPWRHEAS